MRDTIVLPGHRTNHGMTGTAIYHRWRTMLRRCHDPKNKDYKRYGARGITVCERWHNFLNFMADMGNPAPGMQLDRIDGNRGYSPDNCRWATAQQQARNTRTNVMLTMNGVTKCRSEWAEEYGISSEALTHRLNAGVPLHLALTLPKDHGRKLRDAMEEPVHD